MLKSLKDTHGFVDTGDDTRMPGYRDALEQARDEIESISIKWQVERFFRRWGSRSRFMGTFQTVLTKSAYLEALGKIVDKSLAKVVADVIDLHDIPEEESHRLRNLLEVLTPLEALFMEDDISVRTFSLRYLSH